MTFRLFLGVVPDEATRFRVQVLANTLAARLGGDCRQVRPERYHMTLHFLGIYPTLPSSRIDAARFALDRVSSPRFSVTLDVAMSFASSHRRPCVLGCSSMPSALQTCWWTTGQAFQEAGFGEWLSSNYVPHLTVCYSEIGLPEAVPVAPVTFEARELVLMQSSAGEAQYRPLGRWPMTDASSPTKQL